MTTLTTKFETLMLAVTYAEEGESEIAQAILEAQKPPVVPQPKTPSVPAASLGPVIKRPVTQ